MSTGSAARALSRWQGVVIRLAMAGSLAACARTVASGPAPADVTQHIISLEQAALNRWIRSDPDGYLNIYARDATYFDPFTPKRVDGIDALRVQVEPIRTMKPPFTDIRYEMVEPRVQVDGNVAVLSFNLVDYAKPVGSAQETVVARWNSSEVYRLDGGAWKIIHTHWSFVQPQMPAPPAQQASGQPAVSRTELLARDLPAGDFRHVQSVVVTLQPGAVAARHRHDVAVFAYVLEGTVENQFNGGAAQTHTAGESWWEAPGTVHDVARNSSATAPARLLIVYVGEDGKTPTVPLK